MPSVSTDSLEKGDSHETAPNSHKTPWDNHETHQEQEKTPQSVSIDS